MSTIDICLPSYKRPQRLAEMINSCVNSADNPDSVNFYIYVDYDDSETKQAIAQWANYKFINFIIGQKQILSVYYNELLKISKGDIAFLGADDLIFETQNWDVKVREYFDSLPDKIGLFYGEDGHNFKNATHPFVSRKSCEILGYFLPPYFEADFNDLWLHQIYESIGRLYQDKSIMIRHNHRNADAKFDDETYQISEPKRARAAKVWEEMQGQIPIDADKLKKWMNS